MMDEAARNGTSGFPIDLDHLSRQTGGDDELDRELLALFAEQCVKHLLTIRAASAATGRDAAHTLKGAARAVGAWAVADAAEQVERALADGAVPAALPELDHAAETARAAIAAMSPAA